MFGVFEALNKSKRTVEKLFARKTNIGGDGGSPCEIIATRENPVVGVAGAAGDRNLHRIELHYAHGQKAVAGIEDKHNVQSGALQKGEEITEIEAAETLYGPKRQRVVGYLKITTSRTPNTCTHTHATTHCRQPHAAGAWAF